MACVLLWGTPDPSWRNVQDFISELEGLRAEARELLLESGDQFLDQAFRGGTAGVRSVSVVMKEKEREIRA